MWMLRSGYKKFTIPSEVNGKIVSCYSNNFTPPKNSCFLQIKNQKFQTKNKQTNNSMETKMENALLKGKKRIFFESKSKFETR